MDLLKLMQSYNFKVQLTIPVGVVFHRDLRAMEESDILKDMKDQSIVYINMTKKDGTLQLRNRLFF